MSSPPLRPSFPFSRPRLWSTPRIPATPIALSVIAMEREGGLQEAARSPPTPRLSVRKLERPPFASPLHCPLPQRAVAAVAVASEGAPSSDREALSPLPFHVAPPHVLERTRSLLTSLAHPGGPHAWAEPRQSPSPLSLSSSSISSMSSSLPYLADSSSGSVSQSATPLSSSPRSRPPAGRGVVSDGLRLPVQRERTHAHLSAPITDPHRLGARSLSERAVADEEDAPLLTGRASVLRAESCPLGQLGRSRLLYFEAVGAALRQETSSHTLGEAKGI